MATESGFDPKTDNKINKKIHAHGLMQIRNETMKYLGDHHGELKDYLVHLTHDNLYDPSANICAGIRWLFRKKITASSKLGYSATWEEAVIDYKGYWDEKYYSNSIPNRGSIHHSDRHRNILLEHPQQAVLINLKNTSPKYGEFHQKTIHPYVMHSQHNVHVGSRPALPDVPYSGEYGAHGFAHSAFLLDKNAKGALYHPWQPDLPALV